MLPAFAPAPHLAVRHERDCGMSSHSLSQYPASGRLLALNPAAWSSGGSPRVFEFFRISSVAPQIRVLVGQRASAGLALGMGGHLASHSTERSFRCAYFEQHVYHGELPLQSY
jgi:hypothetical protein